MLASPVIGCDEDAEAERPTEITLPPLDGAVRGVGSPALNQITNESAHRSIISNATLRGYGSSRGFVRPVGVNVDALRAHAAQRAATAAAGGPGRTAARFMRVIANRNHRFCPMPTSAHLVLHVRVAAAGHPWRCQATAHDPCSPERLQIAARLCVSVPDSTPRLVLVRAATLRLQLSSRNRIALVELGQLRSPLQAIDGASTVKEYGTTDCTPDRYGDRRAEPLKGRITSTERCRLG